MKVVPLEKVELTLPEVADMAKAGPVILTRNGRPLAAVKDLSVPTAARAESSGTAFALLSLHADPLSRHGHRTRPAPYRWYEVALRLLFIQPYLCLRCGRRFLQPREPDLPLILLGGRRMTAR